MQRRVVDKECYQMYMQDDPIPFGKYPKAKYELWMDRWMFYWFTTTCRSPFECLQLMVERGRESNTEGRTRFVVYQIINGERKVIHDERQSILPKEYMEVRTKEECFKKAIW